MKLLRQITDMDIIGDEKLSKANPRYTARAILIDNIGDIAIMYSKKHLLHSLPGGGIEGNEDKITAAKREILEETGCNCEIIRDLGYVYENRAHSDFTQYSYYYIAKVIGNKGTTNLTENELNNGTAVEWHDLNTAIRLISTPTHKTLQQQFIQYKDNAALNELVELVKNKEIIL